MTVAISPAGLSRRSWLTVAAVSTVGLLGTGVAPAIEPIVRAGRPRLRLALAAYGFRQFFRWSRGKPQQPADEARALTIASFIDLAADLGCDGAELTSYYFDPAATEADLSGLRRHAFLRGIAISGSAVGNNFALPRGVVTLLLDYLETYRQRRALAALDDHMLKDIGLSRCDVEAEISRPFWRSKACGWC